MFLKLPELELLLLLLRDLLLELLLDLLRDLLLSLETDGDRCLLVGLVFLFSDGDSERAVSAGVFSSSSVNIYLTNCLAKYIKCIVQL